MTTHRWLMPAKVLRVEERDIIVETYIDKETEQNTNITKPDGWWVMVGIVGAEPPISFSLRLGDEKPALAQGDHVRVVIEKETTNDA